MERAWGAGVTAIVEVGTDAETSQSALALARSDERIHAVAGLHPHEAKHLGEEREPLRNLLDGGEFAAVGEIGLDFYRNLSPPDAQIEALRWQLDIAREYSLPVVIHARDADKQCFNELSAWVRRTGPYLGADRKLGMMHCFAGDIDLAHHYLDLGFLVSIPGTVTYSNNLRGRNLALTLPLQSMLVETDCPFLTPKPHRGQRNEPAYIVNIVQEVAEIRGCDFEDVATETAKNASLLFDFPLAS